MPITNGYATLAEAKAELGISDAADDAVIERVVQQVSRAIDQWTGRQFYAVTQTRYYTATDPGRLLVDDLLSVTTLKTDEDGDGTFERTWMVTDYRLAPYNAQLASVPRPYGWVEVTEQGQYAFPCGVRRGVEIAGSWGFAATTPDDVKEACLYQVAQGFRVKDAPLGVTGNDEIGQTVRSTALHPWTRRLLETYRRLVVG